MLQQINNGDTGAQAATKIFANDTENAAATAALDTATKAAQAMAYIENALAKWGVLDPELRPFIYIGTNDKLYVPGGLSDDLISTIAPTLAPIVRDSLGFKQIENANLVYGILDQDLRILLGINANGELIANLPALTTLEAKVAQLYSNAIVFAGDSLTAGAGGAGVTIANVVQSLVGDVYRCVNRGVGGEDVPTITARVGSVPAVLNFDLTLPADLTPVEISSNANRRIRNLLYDRAVSPLNQGATTEINPVKFRDILCTMSYTSGTGIWTLRRNVAVATPETIKAGEPFYFSTVGTYNRLKAVVIWIGQNGGYSNDAELVDYIKRTIAFYNTKNFVVVGLHTGTPSARAALETLCVKEFGLRYLNTRRYVSNYALADMGITPTADDITAMAAGTTPPSLWASPTDSVHGNAAFYTAVGRQIFNILNNLGTF